MELAPASAYVLDQLRTQHSHETIARNAGRRRIGLRTQGSGVSVRVTAR